MNMSLTFPWVELISLAGPLNIYTAQHQKLSFESAKAPKRNHRTFNVMVAGSLAWYKVLFSSYYKNNRIIYLGKSFPLILKNFW